MASSGRCERDRLVERHDGTLGEAAARHRCTSLTWNLSPLPANEPSSSSRPPNVLTVIELGQCMKAGRSIHPSVPEIRGRARGADPDRRADTPILPRGARSTAATCSFDPRLPDDAIGDDVLGRAQRERTQLDRIDPEIEQGATRRGRVRTTGAAMARRIPKSAFHLGAALRFDPRRGTRGEGAVGG